MPEARGDVGFAGDLEARVFRAPKPHVARGIRTPFGRLLFTRDKGSGVLFAREHFMSQLTAVHRKGDGRIVEMYDLGSGLVTNVGVNLMANDFNWVAAATPFATLSAENFHAIGTGTTAAAATDYYLQTAQGTTNLSGTTNGYMTGTQSVVAPNSYRTVATFTATGAIAVTEWVLTMANAANVARTSAGAAPTATTFTDTGATYTTSGNGLKGWTIEINSTAVNTPTTTVQGLVTSNSATVLTLTGGWWTLANASASTPGATVAYVVYPTAWDHKVFSAINLANTDTLQFTYTLAVNSGG